MKIKHIRFSLSAGWQFVSTTVLVAGCLSLLFLSRLDSLIPNYSSSELATAKASQSVTSIINNPVNAPYKLTVLGFSKVISSQLLATRLASVTFASLTIVLFYWGVRQWYATRIAFLATVMFACSAWMLHVARHGTPDIMLVLSPILLAVVAYKLALTEKRHFWHYLLGILAIGFTLYTPGILTVVLIGLIVRWRDIVAIGKRTTALHKLLLALASIGFLALPIAWVTKQSTHYLLDMAGLPHQTPSLLDVLKNLGFIPIHILIRGNLSPETNLGHLPYVDIFTAIMFILGLYYYFKTRELSRVKLLGAYIVIGAILASVGGMITTSFLLPVIFIIAGAGLLIILGQWLTVFPVNPLAKTIGVILVTTTVLLSCVYNLRSYFIAWPHNSAARHTYTVQADDF